MLEKALNQATPSNVLISSIPTAEEISSKLYDEIYNRRFEYTDSFEFEYTAGNYAFYCDVITSNHSKDFSITNYGLYFNGEMQHNDDLYHDIFRGVMGLM